MKYRYSKSKIMSWALIVLAFFLTCVAIVSKMETAAIAFWSATVPSAVALYANKQYQDRKIIEAEHENTN